MEKQAIIEKLVSMALVKGLDPAKAEEYRSYLEAKSEQQIINIFLINTF